MPPYVHPEGRFRFGEGLCALPCEACAELDRARARKQLRDLPPPGEGVKCKTGLPEQSCFFMVSLYVLSRYRNVTIWPRVQGLPGLNVVALVPLVISFFTAQSTAS